MPSTFTPGKSWQTYGVRLWSSEAEYIEAIKVYRFRWFKREKATRAGDFEWEVVVDGKTFGTTKHRNLVLMRRSWESLKARIPEKRWRKIWRDEKRAKRGTE